MTRRANDLRECALCGGPIARQMVDVDVKVGARATITVRRRLQHCAACGETYFAAGEMDAVNRAAADLVREREGLLAPEEIRALRASMHLSQAQFERLLRTGPKTVVRWERGTIFQNRSTDSLLRALRDVPQARSYLLKLAELAPRARARRART